MCYVPVVANVYCSGQNPFCISDPVIGPLVRGDDLNVLRLRLPSVRTQQGAVASIEGHN